MNQIVASQFAAERPRGARWQSEQDIFSRIGKPGARELAHIPGKKGLPVLGILPEAVRDPLAFARAMRAEHGPVYKFYALGSWNVQLIGPEANELVLFDRDSIFSAHGGWGPVIEPFFPGALLIQDGARHRANRRVLGEAFRQQKLGGYQQIFDDDIAARIASWRGRRFDAYDEVKRLTLSIAASTFLGVGFGARADAAMGAFGAMMNALLSIVQNRWLSPVAARGWRGRARLEAIVRDLIRAKRAAPGDDILSRICSPDEQGGPPPSDQEICDSIIFLLAAAHDTLASAFTSLIYFLARHPAWVDQLRSELAASGLRRPVDAATAALPFQDMCFKETMRINPPAPIVWRRATRAYRIYGHDVPAGTITGVNPLLVHLDPATWPDPSRFDPLRFTPEAELARHKYAFVPFGGGVHKCLGLHFAQQQARIFMTRLVTTLDLAMAGPEPGWYHWPNCRPRRRLLVSASPRRS